MMNEKEVSSEEWRVNVKRRNEDKTVECSDDMEREREEEEKLNKKEKWKKWKWRKQWGRQKRKKELNIQRKNLMDKKRRNKGKKIEKRCKTQNNKK